MSYKSIDTTLSNWALQNQLNWMTQYHDEEVRSATIVDSSGRKFQLWVDPPEGKKISVHVWDYHKKRKDFRASEKSLDLVLDDALSTIRSWASPER